VTGALYVTAFLGNDLEYEVIRVFSIALDKLIAWGVELSAAVRSG